MNHNPKATANALAVVGGALYLICAVWSFISRESFMAIFNTWTHTVDLSRLPTRQPDFGSILIGLITFVIASWVTGYAFAYIYNYFAKK